MKKQKKKKTPPTNAINTDNNFQVSCTEEKLIFSEIESPRSLSKETLIHSKTSGCQTESPEIIWKHFKDSVCTEVLVNFEI